MSYWALSAEERVAKGVTLLDALWPGWERQINLDDLNLGDVCQCVGAQLMGKSSNFDGWQDFRVFLNLHGIGGFDTFEFDEDVAEHGFDLDPEHPQELLDYDDLTEAWRDLITQRLADNHSPKHAMTDPRPISYFCASGHVVVTDIDDDGCVGARVPPFTQWVPCDCDCHKY